MKLRTICEYYKGPFKDPSTFASFYDPYGDDREPDELIDNSINEANEQLDKDGRSIVSSLKSDYEGINFVTESEFYDYDESGDKYSYKFRGNVTCKLTINIPSSLLPNDDGLEDEVDSITDRIGDALSKSKIVYEIYDQDFDKSNEYYSIFLEGIFTYKFENSID